MNAKSHIIFDTCPDLSSEDEEGYAQMPMTSCHIVFGTCESNLEINSTEETDSVAGMPWTKMNESITFRKPINVDVVGHHSGSNDFDTQCETSEEDSDEDCDTFVPASFQMSRAEYMNLVEKSWFLVKEAKESRYRGLLSPILLRQKMYDVLTRKSAPLSNEILFEKCDLTKTETIRWNSVKGLELTDHTFSKSMPKRLRGKTHKNTSDLEKAVSKFFSFLSK
jgi:hypothetical protein